MTWDPFLAAVQTQAKARILADGKRIAGAFHAAGLLPKPVKATEVDIWKPGS